MAKEPKKIKKAKAEAEPVKKAVKKAVKGKKHNQDGFSVLLGLAGIRNAPGMYLGEQGPDMAYRMVKEVVDNVYDENRAGRCNVVEVIYNYDLDVYIVADEAGGIPTTVKTLSDGSKEAIMVSAFSRAHAGGKFNDDAYKTSAGTHGVGVAAVNAVSERIRVWSNFEKKTKGMEYSKGECVTELKKWDIDKDVVKCLQDDPKTYGTIVAWTPDQSVISEDAKRGKKLPKSYRHARIDIKRTRNWLISMSQLNPGFEIRFTVIKDKKGKRETFLNEKGLDAVVKQLAEDRELTLDGKPFVFNNDFVTLAISWADHPDTDLLQTFVNASPTIDGGWHVVGFRDALENALKPYIKKKKGQKAFTASDLLVGAIGLFDYRMHGAQYTSQVKDKLASRVEKDVYEHIAESMATFFEKNKGLANKIIKRAEAMTKGREELQTLVKSMSDAKKKVKGNVLPDFLTTAEKAKPHERELFVCEGDSAGTGVIAARDTYYQEVLKTTGKPLNGLKASLADVLKHKEVQGMLVAIGADLKSLDPKADNPTLAVDKLRVGNILMLADADPDGAHINVLFLAVIYRLLPDLMKQGRVWVVNAPLYNAIGSDGKHYGGNTFEECRAKAPSSVKDKEIVRVKGWGEASPEMIDAVACNPATRHLIQINPFVSKEHERFFVSVVGDDAVHRRRLLGLED